jgi:hypothetical protein
VLSKSPRGLSANDRRESGMTGRWSKFTGDGSKVGFAFGTEEKALAHAAVPERRLLVDVRKQRRAGGDARRTGPLKLNHCP